MEVITYRTEPLSHELGYAKVFENIVQGTCKYLTENNIKCMVIGVSGGLDSTVTCAICREVSNRIHIPLIGLSLPCHTNQADEISSAKLCGEEFCNEFHEVNLQSAFECVNDFCTQTNGNETAISQGNIKARLRMITLYDLASKRGGIVMDTDNLTENYLGFYTIHGDSCDFNPIGGLWKHEVYELARWIEKHWFKNSPALNAAIEIIPTDGNGVKAGGDLAQIAPNATYEIVDDILMYWVGIHPSIKLSIINSNFSEGRMGSLAKEYGIDTVSAVCMRSYRSEFKRRHLPIMVDIYKGYVTDKEGRIII